MAAPCTRVRQGADVLLCAARAALACARRHRMLRALWPRALDVCVAHRRSVSHHSPSGMGNLLAGRLSGLGFRCVHALSALPLVCRLETTSQRCLAELFLK